MTSDHDTSAPTGPDPSPQGAASPEGGEVLASLPESPEFRLARPVRAGGGWVVDGWEAARPVGVGGRGRRRPVPARRA
ncbi:hypothetical protein AB0K12_43825 [Nonomuraea sp. NPDC049419]|uniref:hypothetical protein n=1 Tax=Nonomuraea sp. NPDC049419 TaxID=3155772 RepID=UPI00341EE024